VFPAVVAIFAAVWIWFYSEDTPHGDYRAMRSKGWINDEKSAGQNLMAAAKNHNSWIMFFQYATTSGVEVTFLNAASKYFQDEFGQSTETAALIASGVGWVNLFATGIGGYVADLSYQKKGMRGRMLWQFLCIFVQGILTIVFSSVNNLGLSIFMLIITAIFVEFSEGSSYGFIPYISSHCEGSVGGIAGAGSLCGAVAFGLLFSQSDDPRSAFLIMGGCISISAFLTPFISIVGESAWFIEPEIGEAKYTARSWNAAITMSSPKMRRQGLVMTRMNSIGTTIRNLLTKGNSVTGLNIEDSDSENGDENGDENSAKLSKILEQASDNDDDDEASKPHTPFDRRMTDRSSISTTI